MTQYNHNIKSIDQTNAYYNKKTIRKHDITESGILAMAHLLGPDAVKDWFNSGCRTNPKDGNKTPGTKYLKECGGFEIFI